MQANDVKKCCLDDQGALIEREMKTMREEGGANGNWKKKEGKGGISWCQYYGPPRISNIRCWQKQKGRVIKRIGKELPCAS